VIFTCSRGTYARVLAEEVAVALGSVGHLETLSRTRSGPFFLRDALSMDKLAEIVSGSSERSWTDVLVRRKRSNEDLVPWRPREDVWAALKPWLRRPIDALSHLPLADVPAPLAERVLRGGKVPPPPPGVDVGGRYLVVSGDQVLAVAESGPDGPTALRVVDEG
jgi:tRNA U55 pseudouridine synthase TruB